MPHGHFWSVTPPHDGLSLGAVNTHSATRKIKYKAMSSKMILKPFTGVSIPSGN